MQTSAAEAAATITYPGLGRLRYFLATIAVSISAAIIDLATGEALSNLIYLAGSLVIIYLVVLRFRNQGASGWWAVGSFVPLINLYVGVRALAFPEGYVDHRKLDTAAYVVIAIFALAIIGMVVSVGIPAYEHYTQAAGT